MSTPLTEAVSKAEPLYQIPEDDLVGEILIRRWRQPTKPASEQDSSVHDALPRSPRPGRVPGQPGPPPEPPHKP